MNLNGDLNHTVNGDGIMSRWLWRSVAFIALTVLAITCSPDKITGAGESGNWKAGTAAHATLVGPTNRTFLVHVPPHRRLSGGIPVPFPLVIVLHGSSGVGEYPGRFAPNLHCRVLGGRPDGVSCRLPTVDDDLGDRCGVGKLGGLHVYALQNGFAFCGTWNR